MTAAHPDSPIDPDDPSHALLLASEPLDWARRATLLVYERHATALAASAERRARQLERDDPSSAETLRRDVANLLRHTCTNYEELVADVAAHYGHGRRNDVIAVLRDRALRVITHRFPSLDDCRLAKPFPSDSCHSPRSSPPTAAAAPPD